MIPDSSNPFSFFCCFVFSSVYNPLVSAFVLLCVCVCVCVLQCVRDFVSAVSVRRYEYDNVSGVFLQSKMFPVQMKSLPN